MKLYIAEKPSLGRAIAEGLEPVKKEEGCIRCKNGVVTWCFGHLLDSAPPEHYDDKYKSWTKETLPIIPKNFELLARKDVKKQIDVIKSLIKEADCVVNAGDPDREGQLLVDEVLEHLKYKGKTERIWLASLDPASVKKALATLKDNSGYKGFRDAADARRQMDWLGGMNLTRAMTIFGRSVGLSGVLSLGRVQTPTLALVVARDYEIENFKPVDYAVLKALIKHANGNFTATFVVPAEMDGVDPSGRLIDFKIAEKIRADSENRPGKITKAETKNGKENQPQVYCLSTLQKDAASQLNLGAQQTLDLAQKLYEMKLTTYPRSDCGFLPEEQFSDAKNVLSGLSSVNELAGIAEKADTKIKSPTWNTGKVTAHHGIIPTGMDASGLSGNERKLFVMIATRYIAQFYPPVEFRSAVIEVELDNKTLWTAKGRIITKLGWKACFKQDAQENDEEENDKIELPSVNKGDNVNSDKVAMEKKQTKPPSRFTEGTLIEAMSSIHLFVSDKNARAKLKETSGLGTEATRAGIIEKLKGREYIAAKGKSLISTDLGRQVIAMSPQSIKDIVTTALMEDELSDIQNGKKDRKKVVDEYAATLAPTINDLFATDVKKTGVKMPNTVKCPSCDGTMSRRKGKLGYFWGCSNYPNCRTLLTDVKGKPGEIIKPKEKVEPPIKEQIKCPLCGGQLTYGINKNGNPYWACFAKSAKHDKKAKFWGADKDGKPIFD